MEEGSSQAIDNISPIVRWVLKGEASSPPPTSWSDVDFNILKFISSYFLFSKEFLRDYQTLQYNSTLVIISLKDNLLLRVLMFKDVDRKGRD